MEHVDRSDARLGGARVLVYSHVAIEMLRRQLFHQLGEALARAILAQSGRESGFHDAQMMLQERSFSNVEAMLTAQYRLLAEGGFGRFEVLDLAVDVPQSEFYARVRCRGAAEAESQVRLFGISGDPACCHLVGYSTGWCSAMSGTPLLTIESHCIAKGDDYCEFETMPYRDFVGPHAHFWKQVFESTSRSLAQELEEKLKTIEVQLETISSQASDIDKLSAPVLQIRDRILVVPLIGTMGPERISSIAETLLAEIVRRRAAGVILDVTGVSVIDSATANQTIQLVRSIKLLGSHAVMSGISANMSLVLVSQGIELHELPTLRTLQEGVRYLEELVSRAE